MDASFHYADQSLSQVRSSPIIDSQKDFPSKNDIDRKVQTLMDEVRSVDAAMEKAAVVKGGDLNDEIYRKKIYRYHSEALDEHKDSLASIKRGTPPSVERKYLPKDPRQKAIDVAKKTLATSKGKVDVEVDDFEDELSSLDAEIKGAEKKSSQKIKEVRRSITPAVSKLTRKGELPTSYTSAAEKKDTISELEEAISSLIDGKHQNDVDINGSIQSLEDDISIKTTDIKYDSSFKVSIAEESAIKTAIKQIVKKKQNREVDISCIPSMNMKNLFEMDLHLALGWRAAKPKLEINLIGLGGDEDGLNVETIGINKLLENYFDLEDFKKHYEEWEIPNLIFSNRSDIVYAGIVEKPDLIFLRNAFLLLKDDGELVFTEQVTKDKIKAFEDKELVFDKASEEVFEKLFTDTRNVSEEEKLIIRERIRVAKKCFSENEGFHFDIDSTIIPCGNGFYVFRFRKISG